MKWVTTLFFLLLFFWGGGGGTWKANGMEETKEVVSNVSSTINLCFGLHCFLCIFLRGKGTNPKNIITTKLGDLKQLMKWRQKSFIVFVAKRKKNLNWGVWLNMWVQRAKLGLFDYLDDSSIPIMPIVYMNYYYWSCLFCYCQTLTSHLSPLQPLCKYTIPKDKCSFLLFASFKL